MSVKEEFLLTKLHNEAISFIVRVSVNTVLLSVFACVCTCVSMSVCAMVHGCLCLFFCLFMCFLCE